MFESAQLRLALAFVVAAAIAVALPAPRLSAQRGGAAAPDEANTFTGKSDRLDNGGTNISRRSFDPGARSYWHSHERGQLIFVQEGRARVQHRGGKMIELGPGQSDYVPPNVEHWHGATPDTKLIQLAVNLGGAIKWGVPVSDAEYAGKQ
jgi:quercetin dioxygenase-like cupin family protein